MESPGQGHGGWTFWDSDGIPCWDLTCRGLRWEKLGVSRKDSPSARTQWAEAGDGRGLERHGQRDSVHSHLRSSRLLLGQARCWPGGFWVLCRQASMAELGARGGAHCAARSL